MEDNQIISEEKPKCMRCGKEYSNPYPEPSGQGGSNYEIATEEYCSNCNAIVMSALFRDSSAFFVKGGRPPWQREKIEGGENMPKGDSRPDSEEK